MFENNNQQKFGEVTRSKGSFGYTPKDRMREALQAVKRKQQNEQALEQLRVIHQVAEQEHVPMRMKIGAQDVFASFELTDDVLDAIVTAINRELAE